MNYLVSWLGFDTSSSDAKTDNEIINYIIYSQFSRIEDDSSNVKMYIQTYTDIINNFVDLSNVVLHDGTIIESGVVANPEHYIFELVKSFPQEATLVNLIKADLHRSCVTIHNVTNDGRFDKHITDFDEFKSILAPYNRYKFQTTNTELNKTTLQKLILCFSNQSSQAPIAEYSLALFTNKYLIHPRDGIVNYDIIFDKSSDIERVLLQSSVVKKAVSDLNNINDDNDPDLIFVTNIILHCNPVTFKCTLESVNLFYYDANSI